MTKREEKSLAYAAKKILAEEKKLAKLRKPVQQRDSRRKELAEAHPPGQFTTSTRFDINSYGKGGAHIRDVGVIKKRPRG